MYNAVKKAAAHITSHVKDLLGLPGQAANWASLLCRVIGIATESMQSRQDVLASIRLPGCC